MENAIGYPASGKMDDFNYIFYVEEALEEGHLLPINEALAEIIPFLKGRYGSDLKIERISRGRKYLRLAW